MLTVNQFKVFYQFQFTGKLKESGISFVHRIVNDAGKTYKPVHYDHGAGIAVADVDGDGLYDIYFVNQLGGNELWKNLGGGKFKNITAEAGVAVPRPRQRRSVVRRHRQRRRPGLVRNYGARRQRPVLRTTVTDISRTYRAKPASTL
jgi:hypothetical protein